MNAEQIEKLAESFHYIYQEEAHRQGDIRHPDVYADLPEYVKNYDRVLALHVSELLDAAIRAQAKRDAEICEERGMYLASDAAAASTQQGAVMRNILFITLLLLVGCSSMPETKVIGPDIENYTRIEHRQVLPPLATCYHAVPLLQKLLGYAAVACADINFETRTCEYWCFDDWSCGHEIRHCDGYDHGGNLQRAWNSYIDKQLKR